MKKPVIDKVRAEIKRSGTKQTAIDILSFGYLMQMEGGEEAVADFRRERGRNAIERASNVTIYSMWFRFSSLWNHCHFPGLDESFPRSEDKDEIHERAADAQPVTENMS